MPEFDSTVSYRNVPGFPGYKVSSTGEVWGCWKKIYGGWAIGQAWKRRKINVNGSGHRYVHLFPGRRYRLVHRLVLEAFVGPCPPGLQCCHADGDPSNNRLENLRWDTQAANMADMIRHGRSKTGEKNAAVKLTKEKVRAIRTRYASGDITQQQLADEYDVIQNLISKIVRRRIWRHI